MTELEKIQAEIGSFKKTLVREIKEGLMAYIESHRYFIGVAPFVGRYGIRRDWVVINCQGLQSLDELPVETLIAILKKVQKRGIHDVGTDARIDIVGAVGGLSFPRGEPMGSGG